MTRDLDQVISDARSELPILRKHGHDTVAAALEKLLDDVAEASEDYRRFVAEEDAMLRSGHRAPWFRQRYPEWERQGHAKMIRGRRHYRLVIVPRRARLAEAREAGRRAARGHDEVAA